MAGTFFAVNQKGSGEFYAAFPPTSVDDNWIARALKIGAGGWNAFKFLFLGPDGNLYATNQSGFFKGPPPVWQGDNWSARATKIGSGGGWNGFTFLFFGPHGDLYAVKDGAFYKGPSSSNGDRRRLACPCNQDWEWGVGQL